MNNFALMTRTGIYFNFTLELAGASIKRSTESFRCSSGQIIPFLDTSSVTFADYLVDMAAYYASKNNFGEGAVSVVREHIKKIPTFTTNSKAIYINGAGVPYLVGAINDGDEYSIRFVKLERPSKGATLFTPEYTLSDVVDIKCKNMTSDKSILDVLEKCLARKLIVGKNMRYLSYQQIIENTGKTDPDWYMYMLTDVAVTNKIQREFA